MRVNQITIMEHEDDTICDNMTRRKVEKKISSFL